MKNRTIYSTLAALSLGALTTACGGAEPTSSVDQPGLESNDPSVAVDGDFEQAGEAITACDDHQYDHWRYLSSLAVAAAQELGRWQPSVDFVNNGASVGVGLTAAGLARCTDGCDNVLAILGLQTNGYEIPRHDPNLLRSKFVAYFDRQKNNDMNNGIIEHDLIPTSVGDAACGYRYWYRAIQKRFTGTTTIMAANSSKMLDVVGVSTADGARIQQYQGSGGANQNFMVEPMATGGYRLKAMHSAKCLRAVSNVAGANLEQRTCDTSANQLFDISVTSGKYLLKNRVGGKCVEVQDYSTANGANIRVNNCNSTATNQQFSMNLTLAETDLPNPASLWNNLTWVGGVENAYLAFQTNGNQVSIDPMGTMVDGGSSGQSGSCTVSSSLFDSTRTSEGKCCEVEGKTGKFTVSAYNNKVYYCKL